MSGLAALPQRMRALIVKTQPHQAPRLFLGEAPLPQLLPGQMLVKVGAVGVNRMDLMQKAGRYPPPPGAPDILGPEAAGVVVAGGPLPHGTPVMCLLPGGGYAEFAAVEPGLCMPVPPNLTVQQAACIPENWLTAYQLLQEVAGVGVALLQILREFLPHARVIAVAGSAEKLAHAASLGAAVGLNYKELGEALGDEALKHTEGRGVDLALDCVGASLFEQTAKALKTDATWVLYGNLGGLRVNTSLSLLLVKRIRLLSTTLRSRDKDYQMRLVSNFKQEILPKFKDGSLQVIIDSTYTAEAAEEAHERLEKGLNIGKVLILMNPQIATMHGTATEA